ncbi:YicC family protein [Deferribacter thermophilus]|uniref:YicC/YloC family endoribonuclease n=1 Tax=Deferribacter thermophilus TaxID=53573 RepID=UPI003C24E981
MVKSMTGYGKVVKSNDLADISVEMRTLNSKYCEINLRLPKHFIFLEIGLKNLIKKEIKRGKVDVFIDVTPKKVINNPILNRNLLASYMSILRELQMESEIIDDIRIDHILKFPDVISYEDNEEIYSEIGDLIIEAVDETLKKVDEMRRVEGEKLKEDLLERINLLEKFKLNIDKMTDENYKIGIEKLKNRLKELEIKVDEDRIAQEVALLVERSDINEELVRVESHILQFRSVLDTEGEMGKKLDFIAQELHREFNTIASKALLSDIKSVVIEAKVEIDKIREQVQNIV